MTLYVLSLTYCICTSETHSVLPFYRYQSSEAKCPPIEAFGIPSLDLECKIFAKSSFFPPYFHVRIGMSQQRGLAMARGSLGMAVRHAPHMQPHRVWAENVPPDSNVPYEHSPDWKHISGTLVCLTEGGESGRESWRRGGKTISRLRSFQTVDSK